MRSHRFINSLLYLVMKESNAKENNAGIRRFFVLFLEKRYISQVIHFNLNAHALHLKIVQQPVATDFRVPLKPKVTRKGLAMMI